MQRPACGGGRAQRQARAEGPQDFHGDGRTPRRGGMNDVGGEFVGGVFCPGGRELPLVRPEHVDDGQLVCLRELVLGRQQLEERAVDLALEGVGRGVLAVREMRFPQDHERHLFRRGAGERFFEATHEIDDFLLSIFLRPAGVVDAEHEQRERRLVGFEIRGHR